MATPPTRPCAEGTSAVLDPAHAAPLVIAVPTAADVLTRKGRRAGGDSVVVGIVSAPDLSSEIGSAAPLGGLDHVGFSQEARAARAVRGRLPRLAGWALLEYLRAEGAIPPAPPAVVAPVEQLVREYRQWLVCERGLAPVTVRASEQFAQRFLAGRVSADDPRGVLGITAVEVNAFLVRECARVSSGSAGCCTSRLRSLLRYLAIRGFADPGLGQAVPRVARWREATIPQFPTRPRSTGSSPRVTARTRPARATMRCCSCWPGRGCAQSKSRGCGWTISIGAPGRSSSTARPTDATSCRCPATSVRLSRISAPSRPPVRGACSLRCMRRFGRLSPAA